jgi:hypothetical protein
MSAQVFHSRASAVAVRGLLLAGAIVFGAAVGAAWKGTTSEGSLVDAIDQDLAALAASAVPIQRLEPRGHTTNAPAKAPRLKVAITLGGTRLASAATEVALPAGSSFGLTIRSDQAGTVHIYAVNPEGQTSKLWEADSTTPVALVTPQFRLDGTRGAETLRIVFQPVSGVDGQIPAPALRQVRILHV